MRILTEIGEISIHAGRDVLLRPSLAAIASLGEPAEIVETFARVMAGDFMDSLAVVFACADEDVSDLFGFYEARDDAICYIPGTAPAAHVIPLAQSLMRHGVVGVAKPLPRRADIEQEYMTEFDAREHAALAMAHLGLTEREAWHMTMTGLVAALRAKFPPSSKDTPGARAPTKDEHEATMEWFERVEAARRAKQGAH
ncbi:DUF6246 family protein [uncultured Castellaniella sp.]|uniref:DUF6246 family protein n=1 Tax=uncultured Castellaniella sp. TaxID=647907 RepID=UPI002632424A|nr:DUF6246 family protein [uncultured Castellaniella sp.]